MRRFSFLAIAIIALGTAARAEMVDGISVVVGDAVITYDEIEQGIAPRLETAAKVYQNNPQRFDQEAQKLRDEQIEQMVERKLILHDFNAGGYATNVLERFIDSSIKDKIQKTFYGDRAKMIKTLQAEGVTYEALREQERENLIVQYMVGQNASVRKILISPLKIENFYKEHAADFKVDDQVKLRMIVIPQSPDDPPGTAKRIGGEILAKVDSGVPFAEMAGVYSTGSERSEGGDRGWVDRSYFKPELAAVAFSLKAGQHSGVIELPEACYLMLVEDVRLAHVRTLPEVRAEIERTLKTQETRRLQDLWIDRLKRKTFIQYY